MLTRLNLGLASNDQEEIDLYNQYKKIFSENKKAINKLNKTFSLN